MLYISGYNKEKKLWAVTDTDDGAVEWLSKDAVFSTVKVLARRGLKIEGVSGSSISVYSGSVNGAFDGVDWEGSLDKVAAKVDPLDALKPRIKQLLSVADRISQVDKATFESTEVVFKRIKGRHSDFVLTLNVKTRTDPEMSLGFCRVRGNLVMAVGFNSYPSHLLYFYTDGVSCGQFNPTIHETDYASMEREKKTFISNFTEFESAFAMWFKKKYNS